ALGGLEITGPSTIISGAIGVTGDQDFFRMTLATPQIVRMETFDSTGDDCTVANGVGGPMRIVLQDGAGTTLKQDTETKGIGTCSALVTSLAAGTYYVRVDRSNTGTITDYRLQVKMQTDLGSETETNETIATANSLTRSDVYVFGGMQVTTDLDTYAVFVPAGKSLRVETIEGSGAETCESNGIDSRIRLFNPAGTELGNDSDAGRGFCSLIDGTGATPLNAYARNLPGGIYYLRVEPHTPGSASAAMQFDYRLVVTVR
ncbi:MAG: hypothetical protein JNK04_08790, partial [Myxococcales bacterium]|nr:hypothetical protein [Myxococcales bacterium]